MLQSTKKPPGSATGGSWKPSSDATPMVFQIAELAPLFNSLAAIVAPLDPALAVALGALVLGEARR